MRRDWPADIICTILIILFVINAGINLSNWIRGIDDGSTHAGRQCGPAHHWVYVRTSVADADLSCERD